MGINYLLTGAIGMASLIAALFFLRFWKTTRDSFFLYFAISFLIQGINRFFLVQGADASDDTPIGYLFRLIAYMLIVIAVIEKNRSSSRQ
ncbi:MAG TPA: DUF5985 family protein [Oxalicibacterium sp.]|jgi:hypothetical protein|nr:DUF5985 family protein [Oxalicibacterium sp.]